MELFIKFAPILSGLLVFVAIGTAAPSIAAYWDLFSEWWLCDELPKLDALNVDRRHLTERLRWWGAALVSAPLVVAFVLKMPVLALPFAILVIVAPRLWLRNLISNRRRLIRTQLAGAMSGISNACRAGLPLSIGIATVTEELSEPLKSEFEWIVFSQRAGRPLTEVLGESKRRLNIEAFTLFASAVQTTLERGGRVTDMLDELNESVRELDRLERLIDSSTASGRRVILILSIFPLLFIAVFAVVFPVGTRLMFTTILGQVLLLLTGVMVCITIAWSNTILDLRQ